MHERGRLLEENTYYPDGLKIAGLCAKAFNKLANEFGYQGNYAEEEEESGYEEFALRHYDPTIGRWLSTDPYDEFASPYVGMGADPVNNVDPDGGGVGELLGQLMGVVNKSLAGGCPHAMVGVARPPSAAASSSASGSAMGAAANAAGSAVAGYLGGKAANALLPLPKGPDAGNLQQSASVKKLVGSFPVNNTGIQQSANTQTVSALDPDAPVSQATISARRTYQIAQHLKAERQSSIIYKVLDNASLTLQAIPGVKQMLGNEKAVHLEGEPATLDETIWGMANTAGMFVPLGPAEATAEVVAAKTAESGVNRIYSARELVRRTAEPGPFHNFPESFNESIFSQGTKTITPNYFKVPKPNLTNTNIQYKLPGSINTSKGIYEGFYEIGVRPSLSGRTEVIIHRFFQKTKFTPW